MINDLPMNQDIRRANIVLLSMATVYFLIEWVPGFIGSYGYFIDELYYVACSKHLAFGYVDHPPLSIFLLRLVGAIIGDSLPAMRLVPSLAGAATVFLTGFIARRLGADVFGQALAAGAAMVSSIYQIMFSFYSMNAPSILLWAICFLILIEIERRDEPRLWLAFGAVTGLGLENKHTIVLLIFGLATGLVLTRARRHFASRWLWIGSGIAILFAGGGVFLSEFSRHKRGWWMRPAFPVALFLFGVAFAPLGLPLLPPTITSSYAARLGIVPQIESGEGKASELPQWLADRFGWEQLVDDVEAVVQTLEPAERDRAIILAPTYGQAGAETSPLSMVSRTVITPGDPRRIRSMQLSS